MKGEYDLVPEEIPADPRNEFDVIVIGAGIAGLAAAVELETRGRRVVLLEGRDRPGGRVCTDSRLGFPVDLGAGWFHGIENNPLVPIVRALNMELVETDWTSTQIHDRDGSVIPEDEVENSHATFDAVVEAAFSLPAQAQISLQEALNIALRKHPVTGRPSLTRWLFEYMANDYAENLHRISHQAASRDEDFQGGDFAPIRGYGPLIENLAGLLDIRFRHRVHTVHHGAGRPVQVHTDHAVFTGRTVLVTLPIGVLRASARLGDPGLGAPAVRFHPQLPARKRKSIQRIGSALMNKVILRFKCNFWHNRSHVFGWTGDGHGQCLVFVNGDLLRGSPILEAQIVGDDAREIEGLDDEATITRAMRALRTMFGREVPAPVGALITRWGQDPFALGAYSYAALGATQRDRAILGEPVGETLFFAGEATHTAFPSTVHGAYLTGLREAARITASLKSS